MEINVLDTIMDIRKRCRMAMDGVISSKMRAHGFNYKLNFGVPVPKIKEIASRYVPDVVLAEKLWKENTRELKILATLLYPIQEFSIETARSWVREIPNQEIREQVCFNLFRKLPYALSFGLDCVNDEEVGVRATGYWLLARRVMDKGNEEDVDCRKMSYLWSDIEGSDITTQNAAMLFLKNTGKTSLENATNILRKIIAYKDSNDSVKKEVFDSLMFEYEYHHGDVIKQIVLP